MAEKATETKAEPETGVSRWTEFWSTPRFSIRYLALLRMALSVILLLHAINLFQGFDQLARNASGYSELFRLAYADWIPALDFHVLANLQLALGACAVLAFFGVLARPALLCASLLVLLPLLEDKLAFNNHHYHLSLLTLLVALMPTTETFSLAWLRALKSGRPPPMPEVSSWAARLLEVLVCVVYAASALSKTSEAWLSGSVLAALDLPSGDARSRFRLADFIAPANMAIFAWLGLLAEFFLAIGWWHPKTRKLWFATGVLFHGTIQATLIVGTFTWQVFTSYLVFAAERSRIRSLPGS